MKYKEDELVKSRQMADAIYKGHCMEPVDRNTLIESLAYALKKILLHSLEGLDRKAMESSIDCFMDQEVVCLSDEDILEKFYTPEDSIRRFMDFLENSGALEDTLHKTLH
ncbi:MAG: hypothetical protein KKD44_04980 [Proteobacteria bacterium]|nr:hypothetical protein [Pseudomonadota bacterium]